MSPLGLTTILLSQCVHLRATALVSADVFFGNNITSWLALAYYSSAVLKFLGRFLILVGLSVCRALSLSVYVYAHRFFRSLLLQPHSPARSYS